VPVTLGNIVGGAGFVGVAYWVTYRKGLEEALRRRAVLGGERW
jgi:formate/nitrite transporter FocA (FNT family)